MPPQHYCKHGCGAFEVFWLPWHCGSPSFGGCIKAATSGPAPSQGVLGYSELTGDSEPGGRVSCQIMASPQKTGNPWVM